MIEIPPTLKLSISADGPAHVRMTIMRDQPAGHLPVKLFDAAIHKDLFAAELKAAGLI